MPGKEHILPPINDVTRSVEAPDLDITLPAPETIDLLSPGDPQALIALLQQQQAYIRQLEQERDLFASGPVLTITWDPVNRGVIQQISPNVAGILGYSVEEMTHPDFRYDHIMHPVERNQQLKEAQENQQKGLDHYNQYYRLKTKTGAYRWFYDQTQCIRDMQGAIIGYKGYLIDETPLMESQQALAAERRRLEEIMQGTRTGTWEWNVQTGDMMINHMWADIIGYTLEELEPISINTWNAHVHPVDGKESDAMLQELIEGKRDLYEIDVRLKHKEGHWVWVLDRGQVVSRTEYGKPQWVSGTHTDITQRKIAEAQLLELNQLLEEKNLELKAAICRAQGANEAKSRYLAHMNHEIRTPLNGFMGFMDLMGTTRLDEEQQELMHYMKQSADHMMSIVNNVLDHAKIEAGEMKLRLQPFLLKDEIQSALAPLHSLARQQNLSLELSLDRNLPPKVVGDAQRLRQIILNLAGNAIKYTPKGRVAINLTCLETREEHHALQLVVEDTGLGMSEQRLEKLFQPFYQVEDISATQDGGTGLGMAITKELVDLMDGEIQVDSTLGEGTRVMVQLMLGKN